MDHDGTVPALEGRVRVGGPEHMEHAAPRRARLRRLAARHRRASRRSAQRTDSRARHTSATLHLQRGADRADRGRSSGAALALGTAWRDLLDPVRPDRDDRPPNRRSAGLDDRDVGAEDATLAVRHAKNGRSRVIPLTRCVVTKLQACQDLREQVVVSRGIVAHAGSGALFQAENGKRASVNTVERNFGTVVQAVGLRQPSPGRGRRPRIHDLRHTMATRTILDWFRQGRDVDAEMYKLSAYLGHAKPSGTWWYIEAVPELLAIASERGLRTLGDGGAS